MGMIDRFLGMGETITAATQAAGTMAEVFTPNATRMAELDAEARAQALAELSAEFAHATTGFDHFVNGLNRLPRPLLTLGTIGLFVHAMIDPVSFSRRMEGLALVPEPLWWLIGAIVSFYFGAREAHHFRNRVWPRTTVRQTTLAGAQVAEDGWRAPAPPVAEPAAAAADETGWYAPPLASAARPAGDDFADNAALREWAAESAAPRSVPQTDTHPAAAAATATTVETAAG